MSNPLGRAAWRTQVIETAIEPQLALVDAHHHIWEVPPVPQFEAYDFDAILHNKTMTGHRIIATVYADSHANYRDHGPDALRVVGEVEYADRLARRAEQMAKGAEGICAGIVGNANLLLGAAVGEVLDAHIAASPRFRGIRHMTPYDPDLPTDYYSVAPHMLQSDAFRAGAAELQRRGLTFDAWVFHPQLPELTQLADALPGLTIVIDHLGGPLVLGRYANRRAEAFAEWKGNMAVLAERPNVVLKIGGINMKHSGMDASEEARPRSSVEVAALQRDHVRTAIDLFGPSRCMFESNFPVDGLSISYAGLWNSFKRMTEDLTPSERSALFSGTANRVYRLGLCDGR